MKRLVYGSIAVIALMATSSAMAEVTSASLTTKGYVDSGLNYLYQRYEPVKTDVSSLKTTVGDSTTGLVKDVNDLKSQVSATTTGLLDRVTTLENNSSAGAVTQLQSDVSDLETLVGTQGDGTQQNPSTGLVADVEDLQDTVGDSTGGLVKDVEDLKDTVGDSTDGLVKDVADLKDIAKEYVGGTGITITDGTGANAGKKVISADVVTTWDPSVLTNP